MSSVWKTLIEIENLLETQFDKSGSEIQEPNMQKFNRPGWVNRVWTSQDYRRAHINVVDARDSKSLWMMHCCIFPHLNNAGPIFGFDVVAGKNKITGCFHDFSPTEAPDHAMITWFSNIAKEFSWKKKRILPDWAKNIFSPFMIAAGNITEKVELDQILELCYTSTDYYIKNIGCYNATSNTTLEQQNYYCKNQKMNPHTPRVMASLGLDKEDISLFIDQCLFPDVLKIN